MQRKRSTVQRKANARRAKGWRIFWDSFLARLLQLGNETRRLVGGDWMAATVIRLLARLGILQGRLNEGLASANSGRRALVQRSKAFHG